MSEMYDRCVQDGGRVITKNLEDGKFIKVCFDKKGKAHTSEPQTRRKNKSKSRFKKPNKTVQYKKMLVEDFNKLKEHFDSNYRN